MAYQHHHINIIMASASSMRLCAHGGMAASNGITISAA